MGSIIILTKFITFDMNPFKTYTVLHSNTLWFFATIFSHTPHIAPCIRYLGYRRGNRDKSRTCRYVVFLTVTAKVDSRVLDVLYYLVTITVVSLCNGVFDTSNVYCLLLYYWRGDSGGISSIPEPYKPEVNILYAAQTLHC